MLRQIIAARVKRSIKDAFLFTYPKVKVKVSQGTVQGCVEKLPDGRNYFRFSGIPYAQSPIAQLRFKSPQKLLKFDNDELDCTRERSPCFHRSTVLRKFIGSEDCLNLNVYVPADASSERKLPVMVFVHGGGFTFDSNTVDYYSPEYLLMEDVIVVTINYRLHAFGFASLPSMGISGNAGLKDQQMALEWVHENIAQFNGDPLQICLFGESAGGSSVYLQTLSAKSRKFINSAICQSGSAVDTWLMQRDGEEKTRRMGKMLGAKGKSYEDIYEALMRATPEDFYRCLVKLPSPDDVRRNLPLVMKPIVERESDDAFMTQAPLELVKSQAGLINFPMMLGKTSGDGMTMGSLYMKNIKSFGEDKVRFIPQNVNIDPDSEEAKALGEEISQFYFGGSGPTTDNISQFINLMTDFYFNIPATMHARLNQIHHPSITQFLYEFDFDGELNFMKKALKMTKFPGACHFDDISYLFRHQIWDVSVTKDSREYKMREQMCKLWTNFAKYGNPTPENHNPLSVNWDPVKASDQDLKHMILDDHPHMETNLHSKRIDFWKSIYERHNGYFLNPKF